MNTKKIIGCGKRNLFFAIAVLLALALALATTACEQLTGTVTVPALSGTVSIGPSTGVNINTALTANYTGSETGITYQWRKDGDNVGTNSNGYTPTTAGSYTVTVSAAGYTGSKTSAAVDVSDPSLSTLSGNITLRPASAVTGTELTANYTGAETGITYQWRKDGDNVGTNSNRYTPATAGSYTVTVSAAGYNTKTSAAVTVTVAPALTGIRLNTASVKTAYNQNERLNLSGLIVTANYRDRSSAAVNGYTSSPANGATLSTTGNITVTIRYTERAVTRTASFTVTVSGTSDDVTLPPNSGIDEVAGKTLYAYSEKIVFASTETIFEYYHLRYSNDPADYIDIYEELEWEGSYSYNSENKTITLAIEYIYMLDRDGTSWTKMSKTQYVDALLQMFDDQIAYMRADFDGFVRQMVASDFIDNDLSQEERINYNIARNNYSGPMSRQEFAVDWLDKNGFSANLNAAVSAWKTENGSDPDSHINRMLQEEGYANLNEYRAALQAQAEAAVVFPTLTFNYELTADGSLLVQNKLPANTGENELQGNTFTANSSVMSLGSNSTFTFTQDRFTATATATSGTVTGTYAYNSADKQVWLRPDKIDNQTMSQFYASASGSDFYDWGSSAANKAAETNTRFRSREESYSLNPNRIGYYSDNYSTSLNRSVPNVPEIKR